MTMEPNPNYADSLQGAFVELTSAQSALNTEPEPIDPPPDDYKR